MKIFWLSDYLLEKKIAKACKRYLMTRSSADWVEFKYLLSQRSQRRIAKMERDQGLT